MNSNTKLSQNQILTSYEAFSAVSVKQFIINQIKTSNNEAFKDVDYLGSNLNSFIDVISVIFQQLMFNMSINVSESSFDTATLYENMAKIVSIINYKPVGKQTSMLPVAIKVENILPSSDNEYSLPKFLTLNYNTPFVLKNEIKKTLDTNQTSFSLDTILFEGNMTESPIYTSSGDEFEIITLLDSNIKHGNAFISDNFFFIYVKRADTGVWEEWTETNSIFLENSFSKKYEKRFNDSYNYEFKFGNGVNGEKLKKNDEIVIFYIISSGEISKIGSNIIQNNTPTIYSSPLYNEILKELNGGEVFDNAQLKNIKMSNIGSSTPISYPETVESIRKNAPKIFSSQNRLFSLNDYDAFFEKKYSSMVLDSFVMNNDDYVSKFLKYYYDIGLPAPQNDSRINIAQVNFMTSTNFNNIYCVVLPKVNTIISERVPNYINNTLKSEMVDDMNLYKGPTHNIVLLDPLYKAVSFGSYYLQSDIWNENQLKTKLIISKKQNSKITSSSIKNSVISTIESYFKALKLGSTIDMSILTKNILACGDVQRIYMVDLFGNKVDSLTFYVWNPLYSNEDNYITQQNITLDKFSFGYFYDLKNLDKLITVIDE